MIKEPEEVILQNNDPDNKLLFEEQCQEILRSQGISYTHRMKKNLQKSAILFGTKSNAYLQINRPIFAYSWGSSKAGQIT